MRNLRKYGSLYGSFVRNLEFTTGTYDYICGRDHVVLQDLSLTNVSVRKL